MSELSEIYTTQKGLNTVGAHLTKWKFGSISKVKWMTVKFLHYPKGEHQLVHKGIATTTTPTGPRQLLSDVIGAYSSEKLSSEFASPKQSLAHFSACRGYCIISTRDPLTPLIDYGLGVKILTDYGLKVPKINRVRTRGQKY